MGSQGSSSEARRPGRRSVPFSPGLVDLLVGLKTEDASEEDFVFASRSGERPSSFWNFPQPGLRAGAREAGLAGKASRFTRSAAQRRAS